MSNKGNDPDDAMVRITTQSTDPGTQWAQPEAYNYTEYDSTGEQRRDWDGNARVYEWDGEEGDIGPEYLDLEVELFGPIEERTQVKGIDFSK